MCEGEGKGPGSASKTMARAPCSPKDIIVGRKSTRLDGNWPWRTREPEEFPDPKRARGPDNGTAGCPGALSSNINSTIFIIWVTFWVSGTKRCPRTAKGSRTATSKANRDRAINFRREEIDERDRER